MSSVLGFISVFVDSLQNYVSVLLCLVKCQDIFLKQITNHKLLLKSLSFEFKIYKFLQKYISLFNKLPFPTKGNTELVILLKCLLFILSSFNIMVSKEEKYVPSVLMG